MLPSVITGVVLGKGVEKAMEFDFSDVKPTVLSALTIFLIVLVTVPLAKWLLAKYPIPGLSELVLSV